MATTTFSGPIKAGTISNTTGTTLGDDVRNTGQVVMTQSIMIDAAVAAGTTTYNVGVIPKNSQLLTTTIRVAIASDQGTSATVSVGKTGTAQYFIANTNIKAQGETSSIADAALDEADRFGSDTQITATLIAVGTTATTGQVTVTFTYVQEEEYNMAQTTFSGPIRAGTISNTTGTTLGDNVANVGQVVMSQSIMIDAAVAAGTTTYNVGVIPKNSQLLTTTIRVAIASDQGTTATVSVGKTGSAAYFIGNTDVKTLGETSSIADAALDEADRFGSDTQITATLIAVGTTATTGQVTVTFTYVQANNLQDATAV
jgi:hypothetical protein